MVPESPERVTTALFEVIRRQPPAAPPVPGMKFSIAISRETGAGGKRLARALGARLGWNVYDHELLEEIAADLQVRVGLLEAVDERHVNWLQERMEAFAAVPYVSESAYVRQLIETLLSISVRGNAVIVGRGAAHILSHGSTLAIRVVSKFDDRVENLVRELSLARDASARLIRATDAQRVRFVRDHFQCDPTDPVQYDLVVNTSRFNIEQSVELVVEALEKRQRSAVTLSRAAG
jgi:cytidylate kinase